MNTKSKNPIKFKEAFDALFNGFSEEEKLKSDERLLMFRLLDIVERKREEYGWSRKELAQAVGTSASYITQLMRGDKLVNIPILAKFQKALNFEYVISEKSDYIEETKEISTPYADVAGVWCWKPFKNAKADYDVKQDLPDIVYEKIVA